MGRNAGGLGNRERLLGDRKQEPWSYSCKELDAAYNKTELRRGFLGTPLVAQWIRLCAPNAGGPGSIPGQGTRSHMYATTKEPWSRN